MADENKKEFHHHNQKETHGLRDDINEETPINEVKGPNVFERAKEEIEAIVEAIHHPKKETKIEKDDSLVSLGIERDSARNQELKPESPDSHSEKNCKSPKSHNFLEKAKEEIEALIHHKKKSHHHKETHGTSDDIDENTSIREVKGPGMFQRAKEEMEAIIGAIHPKKDSDDNEGISKKKNKEEGGFRKSIGRGLEKRHLLDILDKASADDILIVLAVANMCGKACERLFDRCIQIIVKSDVDVVTLDKALPHNIVQKIMDARLGLCLQGPVSIGFPDKHVKRIHRALDSDDVELVRMLLKEGHTTLDDAYALHYAVAYCDAKTTSELLDLALSNVNHRNPRGYTVLHVAAMRKEPKIIVSLLTKGARPSDLTSDGRKALQISKRLTRYADYKKPAEEGKDSPKDRLCIEILEQAERRDPLPGEASVSLAMAGDELRMKLLYLENRVALAKLLFPMEAKVAMDIAQVDSTSEFPLAAINKVLVDAQRTTVDLNESPFKMKEEHLNRMRALSRTVELGKRFFPRCSEVLNKIMDADDLSEIAYMGNDTPEERQLKKQRYMELQEILSKAFSEDKLEFDKVRRLF